VDEQPGAEVDRLESFGVRDMRIFKSNRKECSRAQTMVEFALIMPMLLMLIYGLFEVGRVIFVYSIISTAAREAVRYGSATGLNVTGGIPRYDDCPGILEAADNVDFLGIIEKGKIVITYKYPYRAEPDDPLIWKTYGGCPPPKLECLPNDDGTLACPRISVQVLGDFVPIVPIIPWAPWTVVSNSSRTLLFDIQIQGTPGTPFITTYTPSPTRTPTITTVPSNTPTPKNPTRTPLPTQTASITPTPGPPTSTPFICGVTHSGNIPSGTDVSWTVYNPHVMDIEINMLRLEWAIPRILLGVWFNGTQIFWGNTRNTGILVPLPGGILNLPPGAGSTFRFTFDEAPKNIRAEILLNTLGCTGKVIDSSK